MSCFLVSDARLTYLAAAAVRYGVLRNADVDGANALIATLHAANVDSCNARYADPDATTPAPTVGAWDLVSRKVEPVQTLKAIACLEYQSNEASSWKDSEARRICNAIRNCAIACLDGYETAAWEVQS